MRMRWTLAALVLVVSCSKSRLSLIERETLAYKSSNERVRAEDLEARYRQHKERADRLADEVLQLGVERDRLFERYDSLRADLAQLRKKHDDASTEQAKLVAAIATLDKENENRRKRLLGLQEEMAKLAKEAKDAEAKRRAFEEKLRGGGSSA